MLKSDCMRANHLTSAALCSGQAVNSHVMRPKTVILRYAPRQQHQDMNTMFANATPHGLDTQGSLRDAEMGAFYHWIEMQRITALGELTFIAWAEEHPYAVVCGPGAAAGAISTSPLTLQQTVKSFG
jgi:hypothetical protein